MSILPKTRVGRFSAGFIAAFFVLFGLQIVLVTVFHQEGGNGLWSNPSLAITGLSALFSGLAAFFTGVFSLFWKKERSVLVFLASLIGFLLLIFLIGEFTMPH
ncbi:MAG: hypothetical protein C4562_05300 [Actinobacteria bacterium]|nr:MAG: hypothetical protein C4562_05300 [Actinomycetota bacterium]